MPEFCSTQYLPSFTPKECIPKRSQDCLQKNYSDCSSCHNLPELAAPAKPFSIIFWRCLNLCGSKPFSTIFWRCLNISDHKGVPITGHKSYKTVKDWPTKLTSLVDTLQQHCFYSLMPDVWLTVQRYKSVQLTRIIES